MVKEYSLVFSVLISAFLLFASCGGPATPNLAFRKPAYHSSSQGWINTAQLAVDGRPSTHWSSRPNEPQWLYVDLGTSHKVNRVIIRWEKEYAREFSISISMDAKQWTEAAVVKNGSGGVSDLAFQAVDTRYVRLSCTVQSLPDGYSVQEFEVYAEKELPIVETATIGPRETILVDTTRLFFGWKLENAAFVNASGEEISRAGFKDETWLDAWVPSTALGVYLGNGVLPDPNFGDQQFLISESMSTSKFWYRNEIIVPKDYPDGLIWINFNGINYEADVFLNGKKIGNIKGAFIRGRFDITDIIQKGTTNALAVLIYPVPHPGEVSIQRLDSPGPNGGAITTDGPTFISSAGWDWMPTIRGRNCGIWQDVFITRTGPVTLADPFVITDLPLPQTDSADLTVKVEVSNNSTAIQSGKLICKIEDISIEKQLTLEPKQVMEIALSTADFPQLKFKNPRLWWPNGFGKPELYPIELAFKLDSGSVSDTLKSKFGIREVEATNRTEKDPMTVKINGEKILIRGGNWGIDDAMKGADEHRLRTLMRLHKEANLNMIRNWTGQTTEEMFYALCDEYGFLVWDDFWLANVSDGPDPADTELFLANAADKIKRFRIHPSIILWCARNESVPPDAIDRGLRQALEKYDNTRRYQIMSNINGVTGNGPYSWQEPARYFSSLAKGFSTEIGLPCIPSIESIRAMMPEEFLWRENDMWGVHDFTNGNLKASFYTIAVINQFDKSSLMEEFSKKAQMVNMESYKAIFESWGNKMWDDCTGLLLWMSNPSWPSFAFQLYDYFLEPTAAYFAAKKSCEPVHILWDRSTDFVNVTNTSLNPEWGLSATVEIINMDGTIKYRYAIGLNAPANSVTRGLKIEYPGDLSPVHFIRLQLRDSANNLVSENFYWRGRESGVYVDLNKMEQVELECAVKAAVKDNTYKLMATVRNPSNHVALMVRLKPVRDKSKQRILPVFFSDNYFSLLPWESKQIEIEMDKWNLGNEAPMISMEGWNIKTKEVPVAISVLK
jgi:hypothetical protein